MYRLKKKIFYEWDGGGVSRDVYIISIYVVGARDNCVCDWGFLRFKGYLYVEEKYLLVIIFCRCLLYIVFFYNNFDDIFY